MNCSELHDVLPEIGDSSESVELQAHLKTCTDCSELVADLELIARESGQLAETDEPAPRVWVKIAAELRAEGIIRDTETAPARPTPVPSTKSRWNAWWLVPVAAALIAAGSYVIKPRPAGPVATQNPPAVVPRVEQPKVAANADTNTKAVKPAGTPKQTNVEQAQGESPNQAPLRTVGTSDQELLNGVSPQMRSAYEKQLQAVNAYIHDADAYLQKHPGDEDARQHLMEAYEQREMLYQMALDHVQ